MMELQATQEYTGQQIHAVNLVTQWESYLRTDTDGNGTTDSDFQVDFGVIIADANDASRGTACGTVTAVNPGTDAITVVVASGALAATANPVQLFAVPAHEYVVNGNGQLLRDGMLLAQGVEDMQFAVFIDTNDNNTIDVNEYRGDGVDPDYVASTIDHEDAREIRVNLVLRTRAQDPELGDGQFQLTENRTAVAGNDGFRRRVHTSISRLRNVAMRS